MNKHNIDNQAVTHYFNFIFKGYQYNKITTPNFLELLKDLKDFRREQGKMHSLEMIITISLSIISINTSIRSMAIFAQRHKKDLCDLFKLKGKKRRAPSKKTIWRALTKINFKGFQHYIDFIIG